MKWGSWPPPHEDRGRIPGKKRNNFNGKVTGNIRAKIHNITYSYSINMKFGGWGSPVGDQGEDFKKPRKLPVGNNQKNIYTKFHRNQTTFRWNKDIFWCFAIPWIMRIYLCNVIGPPFCKWLPLLSESESGMAVYPFHFRICPSTSVPNLMLVSQSAQLVS